jgi:hypothetical protein
MDRVGIELQLKSNLEQQLNTIMPLLTNMNKQFDNINKTMSKMEDMQKRTIGQFDKMANSISNVGRKESELQTVNKRVMGVGQSADKATGLMSGLARSIGAVVASSGPLFVLYKLLQGITAGVGEGLNFQSAVIGLRNKGFTEQQTKEISDYALQSSASGKTILTPTQQIEAAAGALPILGAKNVRGALPEYNRFTTAMRRSNIEVKSPEILSRFWELYAVPRNEKSRQEFDQKLAQVLQGSGVPIEQLLYQSNIYGTGIIGRDPIEALTEVGYIAKESGAGLKGAGGGGRGRAGYIARSLDAMISQGKVPQATLELWYKLGRLPGIEKYMTAKKGDHTMTADLANKGKHVWSTGSGASTGGKLSKSVYMDYLLHDRPLWMTEAGKSDDATVREMVLMAAQASGITGTPMQMIDKFHKLPDVQQKQMLGLIAGSNQLVATGVMQYGGVGKYKTGLDIFKDSVTKAPGFNVGGQESLEQRFLEFTSQFDSFMDAFINTPEIMDTLNTTMNGLISAMKVLNDNVGHIVEWMSGKADPEKKLGILLHGNGSPERMASGFSNLTNAIYGGGAHGPNVGRMLWKNLKGGSNAVIHNIIATAQAMGKDPATAIATAMHESGLNPFAVGDHGTSFGLFQLHKGGELGKMSPQQAFDPITNMRTALSHFGSGSGGAVAAHAQRPLNPTAYAKAVDALMPRAREIVLHNTVMLDGKVIAKETSHHTAKAQMKTARKMTESGGKAYGSFTAKQDNSGGSH